MQQQEDKNYALVSNLDFYLQMKPKPDTWS
jgi:hypothetical protein